VFLLSLIRASDGPAVNHGEKLSPTITLDEAKDLMNLLPATKELRAKGMDVKWDVRAVPTMNNRDYYFFWIYNVTAQKESDVGSISVGNYAVNKHTADVRVWQVSYDVFYGDDGILVSSNELERLQEELRKKHGVDSTSIQEYRLAHLAKRIIPRALAQSAMRLPITQRSSDTAEVSCWKDSDHLISRLARSPIISSSAGYRAYAEVEATAFRPQYQETYTGPLCKNSIKLFLAKGGESTFEILLDPNSPKNDCTTVEGAESCEVKGVHLVDWSKDGRFLLADLVLWIYESDALFMRVPVIYKVTNTEFLRPDVYHFFDEYYKTDASKANCEYELSTEGFSPDGDLILSASRTPPTSHYDQVFCVDEKQTFLFDLGTNKIKRLPSNYKAQHYGIWNSGATPKP
jgi:WD40 repeat protein